MSDVNGEIQKPFSQNPMKIAHIIIAVIMACLIVGSLKESYNYGLFTKIIAFIVGVTCPQKTGPPKKLVYGVGTEGLQWVAKTSQQSRLSSSYARSRC